MSDMISGCRVPQMTRLKLPSCNADDPHAKKSCRHVFSRWSGLSSNMVGETHNIGIGYNVQIRPHLLS